MALFVLAVAMPGARGELLACATLAAAAWIGTLALVDDRRGPRSRLVMAFALVLLAALPALLLAFDHGLWIGPPRLRGLDGGLAIWSLGIASIAVGVRLVGLAAPAAPVDVEVVRSAPNGRRAQAVIAAIVLVSLVAFVHEVGGPISYLKDLNNSAAANAGLTYLIWGISFAKYGAFAHLGESWLRRQAPSRWVAGATILAIVLLLFLGSRLLLLVGLIQLLLLYAALRPTGRRFVVVLTTVAIFGVVAFIGLGEFRRWENVPSPRPSFAGYLVHTSLPHLPKTYVNNYADAVRSSVIVRQVVPARAPYEDGKEFLRILLQPVPGSLRPHVSTAPALLAAFTTAHGNGNALPVPVVGYIQFGLAGDVVFCLVLGGLVGLIDRLGAAARDIGSLLSEIGAGTGMVIVFRGTLHNAIAFALIDVIGFFLAHRILFRRLPATCSGASVAGVAGR